MKKIYMRLLLGLFFALGILDAEAQVTVSGSVGGTKDGVYASFTGAGTSPNAGGGVFAALNSAAQTGAVITISITADVTTEAGTNSLNAGAWTSILINPVGVRTISGAPAAGTPLINFNGADNVIIDGLNAGGNGLTISNTTVGTTAGTSTLQFIADATNNTITNCTVLGSATSTLATGSATIAFRTATTTGNDNNTISNCNIGPAGANLPSKAIVGVGTTTSQTTCNSGITITNNNIFDFFLPTGSCAGINISAGNDAWAVSNNKIYQSAARTFSASASRYSGIAVNGSTVGSIHTISGNTIGFGASNGTGTTIISGSSNEVRGIDINASNTTTFCSIQGNIISGINQTTSRAITTTTYNSACFIGIASGTSSVDAPANIGNVTGNTIGSQDGSSTIVVASTSTTTSTAPVIGILDLNFQNGISISNNNIGSITINNGGSGTTVGFRGILISSTTAVTRTINNNTIGGTATGSITDNIVGTYSVFGIQAGGPNITATGNVVRNMSGNSNGSALIVSGGILISGSTGVNTISQNTIYSLSNASAGGSGSIYGMSLSLPSTANVISRNLIHSFSITSTVTGCQLWGISTGAAGTATYQNNMIRLGLDSLGNAVKLPASVIGIRESAGCLNNYYHNSVYISGTGVLATPAASSSYAFLSSVATGTRSVLDNIFVNARGNATSGGIAHIAVAISTSTSGLTSNYNDLYVSGTDGAVGVFNSIIYPTIAGYKTATALEANSFNADPQFVTPTGTAATVDLHINPTVATVIEGTGLAVGAVTDDYDGQTRSGLTPTDIGADAGNFTAAVNMSYVSSTTTQTNVSNVSTNSTNQQVIGIQVVTTGAINALSATSFSVNTNGTTNIADITNAKMFYTGLSSTFAATSQFGTTVAAPSGAYNITGTQALAEGTNYFWLTYDVPCSATATDVIDAECTSLTVGSVQTPTITDPGTGRSIVVGPLVGTYTVGTGGNYTTLTAAATALNTLGLAGNATFSILNSITEPGAVVINQWAECGAGGYTLTIKPAAGVTPTISASSATAVIKLNGADRVIIDGSNNGTTSRDLTISNTSNTTTTAAIWLGSALPDGAHNNTIRNCNISAGADQSAGALFTFGIISSSSAAITTGATDNDNNTFDNNLVTKVSVGISSFGGSSTNPNQNTIIRNNNIGPASFGSNEIGTAGVLLFNENSTLVSNNDIGFVGDLATSGGGSGRDRVGIVLGSTGATWSTTGAGTALLITNATITKNKIHDIIDRGSFSAVGITVNGIDGTNITNNVVANNMLYNIQANGTGGDCTTGIGVTSGKGDIIAYNSISLTGDVDPGAAASASTTGTGISMPLTAPVNLTVKDNIVVMDLTSNTTSLLNAAISTATGFAWGTGGSNYNDLYAPGTNTQSRVGSFGGAFQGTLANWQTASTQDANSISVAPTFISPTNLHLATDANCALATAGDNTGIALTNDIDGDTRGATATSIGADEFTSNFVLNITNPAATCSSADLTATAVTATSSTGATLTYWSDAGATTAIPAGNGTASAITTSGTYYIKSVKGSCSGIKPVVVTITSASTNTILATSGTNGSLLPANCTDSFGWTYYSDPSDATKILFGINWDPSTSGANAAAKAAATPSLQVEAAPFGITDGTANGTWTMNRYWNVNLNGSTMTSPVSVRFFYDPSEKAATDAARDAFVSSHPGSSALPTTWFKTVGTDFANDATHVTYNGVLNSITLTDDNAVPSGTLNSVNFAQFDGVTSFSGGTYAARAAVAAPLPINITYFNGAKQGSSNLLNWKVNVVNSSTVTLSLERSADGRSFASVYSTTATDTRALQPFTYTDANPLAGINYYRLKMTDANGKISYSSIVALLSATKGFEMLNIAPNPVVSGNFKLNITAAEQTKMTVIIADLAGRMISRRDIVLTAGFNGIDMNIADLAAGTYQLYGNTADGKTKVLSFVKK